MVANGHDSQFQLDSGATVNVLPTNERLLCQLDGLKQLLRKGWNKVMGSSNKGWTHLQQEPKTSEVVSRAIPDSTPR